MKPSGLTRRALARYAAPVLLGATAQAQAPSEPAVAAPGGRLQNIARQLASVKLPRNTEPATRFEP